MVRPIRHWPIDLASGSRPELDDVVEMRLLLRLVDGPGPGAAAALRRVDGWCWTAVAMVVEWDGSGARCGGKGGGRWVAA